jgi:hypothetical protein
LDKLSKYFDLFPDNLKRKIAEEKLEIERIKAGIHGGDEGNKEHPYEEEFKDEIE